MSTVSAWWSTWCPTTWRCRHPSTSTPHCGRRSGSGGRRPRRTGSTSTGTTPAGSSRFRCWATPSMPCSMPASCSWAPMADATVTSRVRYHDHSFPVAPGTADGTVREVLARQHYVLASWRDKDDVLAYRRFFDVDTLVAVRVELPDVFDATHGLLVDLYRRGVVDGFRVDHPDGLADPEGYLERLRDVTAAASSGRPAWVVVEKILEGDETLPASWPCAGTTGYDALRAVQQAWCRPPTTRWSGLGRCQRGQRAGRRRAPRQARGGGRAAAARAAPADPGGGTCVRRRGSRRRPRPALRGADRAAGSGRRLPLLRTSRATRSTRPRPKGSARPSSAPSRRGRISAPSSPCSNACCSTPTPAVPRAATWSCASSRPAVR